MTTYFAKPRQCYRCHIQAVYKSWDGLYDRREPVIRALCTRYGIDPQRFRAASLLTVALHDAGKPARNFQSEMVAIRRQEEAKEVKNQEDRCLTCSNVAKVISSDTNAVRYRHEIISGIVAIHFGQLLDEFLKSTLLEGFPFEFFSIIGHHKPVNSDSFRREWDEFSCDAKELERIGFSRDEWVHVTDVAKELFQQKSIEFPTLDWTSVISKRGETIIDFVKEKIDALPLLLQEQIEKTGSTKTIGIVREIHALLKSLLIAADWEGSSGQQIHRTLDLGVDQFWSKVKKRVESGAGREFVVREFQNQLSSLSGHGIAVAPTGSGKTEGAVAWALNQREEFPGKILYLLPTQVLTNSIYERLVEYLDPGRSGIVGLLHHGALLYQIHTRLDDDVSDQYDPGTVAPTKDEKEIDRLNKMMFRPVMVATVDQLLSLAFNGSKRWAVVMGELMGGTIIFDEVHAYDGHMLALLERVARELRDSTRFLFMSATMPENLKTFLSALLGLSGGDHVIEDRELLSRKRNEFRYLGQKLLDKEYHLKKPILDEIRSKLEDKHKRVAIVCNTVRAAQAIYEQLRDELKDILMKDEDISCFHSRFIFKDRRDKEKNLEKDVWKSREEQAWPRLLVATQVIECGLDIDYDVMYTEGAPLEALIQRSGRVNRAESTSLGELHVFQQDDSSKRFYPPEITQKGLEVLEESLKAENQMSEQQFIEMIEKIYKDKKFESDPRFLSTRRILDDLMYDIGAIQDLPETDLNTRFITYKMVEVVPEKFWNQIKDSHPFEIMDYLVKMPLWAYLQNKSTDVAANEWKVMEMDYDSRVGGKLKNDKDNDSVFFA